MRIISKHNEYCPEELLQKWPDGLMEEIEPWMHSVFSTLKDWYSGDSDMCIKTSGSTGTPKPILLSKKSIQESVFKTQEALSLREGFKALLCLPAEYIAGKMMIIRALEINMDLYIRKPSGNPLLYFEDRVDFAAMTPFQLANILRECPGKINLIRKLIIGGSPVPPWLSEKIADLKIDCWHTFGMTETITHVALQKLSGPDRASYFTGLPGVKFEQGTDGRLHIITDHLEEIVRTNDLVELINDHSFRWIGRADNIINSGGVKIAPESVEKSIFPLIPDRFFIGGEKDNELGQRCILLIEAEEYSEPKLTRLREKLKTLLTRYEIPQKIYFVPKFRETKTGKLIRDLGLYELNKTNCIE